MKNSIVEICNGKVNILTTGRIFRRDRTFLQNLKRLSIIICRDTIYKYIYNNDDSKYDLIRDRRYL